MSSTRTTPCRVCGSVRFNKNNRCADCHNKRTRKHYSENTEQHKQGVQQWRKDNREKYNKTANNWKKNNPEKIQQYKEKNAHKINARSESYKAIMRGDIPHHSELTCKECGTQAQNYHHEDYSKPLSVTPVCAACHGEIHSNH